MPGTLPHRMPAAGMGRANEGGFLALIPVKRLGGAKSRLAGVLRPAERVELALRMLDTVMVAAKASALIGRLLVITSDPLVRNQALAAGAGVLDDQGFDLNPALERAILFKGCESRAWVVLPADLPHLTPPALDSFLAQTPHDGAMIASDQHGSGTNALAWRGDRNLWRFAFGANSFDVHRGLASDLGVPCRSLLRHPAFCDVDVPEDLGRLSIATQDRAGAPAFEVFP